MRYSRALLVLLIAAALLGAAGAEAARTLPAMASAPQLEPPSFSAAELLGKPAADTAGDRPFRLISFELFSFLTSSPCSMTNRAACTVRTTDLRTVHGEGYRLYLAWRPGLPLPEPFVSWKTASGDFDKLTEANVRVSLEIAADLRRPTFQGLWTDPVTGLSYARNRWYDARTASWLSTDPLGPVDSQNLYAFVGWAPHMGVDPMGLSDDWGLRRQASGREIAAQVETQNWLNSQQEQWIRAVEHRAALEAIKQEALWSLGDTLSPYANETDLRNALWDYLYENKIGYNNTERCAIIGYILGPANRAPYNDPVYAISEKVGRYYDNYAGSATYYFEVAAALPLLELSAPLTRVSSRFLAKEALGRAIRTAAINSKGALLKLIDPMHYQRGMLGGWLRLHETWGGHTIAKHVGKTFAQLRGRLLSETWLSQASSFADQAAAQKAILEVFSQNSSVLAAWTQTAQAGERLTLTMQSTSEVVGSGVLRGSGGRFLELRNLKNARVILEKMIDGSGRIRILTAYPF